MISPIAFNFNGFEHEKNMKQNSGSGPNRRCRRPHSPGVQGMRHTQASVRVSLLVRTMESAFNFGIKITTFYSIRQTLCMLYMVGSWALRGKSNC